VHISASIRSLITTAERIPNLTPASGSSAIAVLWLVVVANQPQPATDSSDRRHVAAAPRYDRITATT
jgi:hypothetical protein